MIRNVLSAGAIAIALATPAWAQGQCVTPTAPTIPDGTKASPAQITTAQNEIKAFADASDSYQTCLAREIARQKDLAKQSNVEFDPGIEAGLQTKADAQRKDAGRLASAWGAVVQAFNDAQQRKKRAPTAAVPATRSGGYTY
jgi:hypothetical protein